MQLYGTTGAEDFPHRVLLGFEPVQLEVGESALLEVGGTLRPLQRWADGAFVWAAPEATLEAAAYSGDPAAATVALRLPA